MVLLSAVFLLSRELLVRAALARAGARARELADVAQEVLPPADPALGPRREALLWLFEPETDDRVGRPPAVVEGSPSPSRTSRPRLGPDPATAVVLSHQIVLGLAERGAMPRGVSRPATGDLPAGIEILEGGGLGIGWFPGDRLVLVDGVAVTDRAQVVRRVMEGRARRQSVITATLARRTQGGTKTYLVLVEQPYFAADAAPSP